MHRRSVCALLISLSCVATALFARPTVDAAPDQKPTAEALLELADRARGGIGSGATWIIESVAIEDGEEDKRSFNVKTRGSDALVEALSPARNRGEVYLFNNRALWFVKPGLRKPVSISPRQKLSGSIANGDIASTNYAGDYAGVITGEEPVNGEACFVLNLKARVDNVTYDRIRYWISKQRGLGVKAEFRTVSDVVFKVATFEYANKVSFEGKELAFVSKMVITDPRSPKDMATMRFMSPKLETHPSSMFNINNVLR